MYRVEHRGAQQTSLQLARAKTKRKRLAEPVTDSKLIATHAGAPYTVVELFANYLDPTLTSLALQLTSTALVLDSFLTALAMQATSQPPYNDVDISMQTLELVQCRTLICCGEFDPTLIVRPGDTTPQSGVSGVSDGSDSWCRRCGDCTEEVDASN